MKARPDYVSGILIGILCLLLYIILTTAHAAEQQTLSGWQWFLSLQSDEKWQTLLLAGMPGIVAILGTLFIMSTLRNIHPMSDKKAFWAAIWLSAGLGALSVVFLMDIVNDLLEYPLYSIKSIFAALFLTPIANHIIFRLIVIMIMAVHGIGKAMPQTHMLYWLASPAQDMARLLYFTLTGKDADGRSVYRDDNNECSSDDMGAVTRLLTEKERDDITKRHQDT
jgi:hypothetical protein